MAKGDWKLVGKIDVKQPGTVLGFDPSSTAYGICVIRDGEVHVSQGDFVPGPDRWDRIYRMIKNIVGACADDGSLTCIMIEEMVAANASSALYAGQVFGLSSLGIYHALDGNDTTKAYAVAPNSMKKLVTGKGNCEKDQILLGLHKLYGLDCSACTNNEADAIGIGLCALVVAGMLDVPAIRMLKEDKLRDLRAEPPPKVKKPRPLRST